MDLDLTNFERDRTDENLEGGIFNINNKDFSIVLNKEDKDGKNNLQKILEGGELKSELYWIGGGIDIKNLDKRVKKELTICLLSDSERIENQTEALPINNIKDSEEVKIKISKDLIKILLNYKGTHCNKAYSSRYDRGGNKMHFYIIDSTEREILKDDIDFIKKIYNLNYPKNEE